MFFLILTRAPWIVNIQIDFCYLKKVHTLQNIILKQKRKAFKVMVQLHKRFADSKVRELLKRYVAGEVKRKHTGDIKKKILSAS